ncbi:MAG: DegT/DnrJ/EryC1/StrS family aminotransferase [Arenicellales bacterium]
MFYQLPPVGNPVRLSGGRNDESLLQEIFHPYSPRFFDSGTSALAASILAAIGIKGTPTPEVILPAYGCPDLISAIVYAGAKPVLVDLEAGRPWMALDQVSAHITADTVAVIAASLCGIPERLAELRQITEQSAVLLIEDSAQLFPGSVAEANWQGDLVVISFGRGKPVSLLGGGAVWFRDERLGSLLPGQSIAPVGMGQRLAFRITVRLYNQLISPRSYWILQGLPFLHLGETRYYPLDAIGPLAAVRKDVLKANVECYLEQGVATQVALSRMSDSLADDMIVNLPAVCNLSAQHRLLRYPLLVASSKRNRIVAQLSEAGLGVSVMYPGILPAIPGLEALLAGQGPFPAAAQFSRQLLTLPTHAGVGGADIHKIAAAIHSVTSEKTV